MNALAELRKRASTAAIPAIPAIRAGQRVPESRKSQESQGVKAETRFSDPAPAAMTGTLRTHLLLLAGTLGIPRAVVDALPVEELEATAEQVASCEGHKDGHGDPLPHALLVFYLKELARRVAT